MIGERSPKFNPHWSKFVVWAETRGIKLEDDPNQVIHWTEWWYCWYTGFEQGIDFERECELDRSPMENYG